MTKIKGAVVVDAERCKGCELCVVACPMKVLALSGEVNGKGYRFSRMVSPEVCPDSCITVYRQKFTEP